MSTIWGLLSWFLDNWLLIPWGAGLVLAYIYGGKRLAFVVLTLGFGAFAYRKGIQNERDALEKRVADVKERRENAFEEIDNRATDKRDLLNRLRDGGY
jgi:hypothetical protein